MKSLGKTLNDYCELIVDCEHKTAPKENHDTGFYSVRTPNIGRGRLILGNVNCVSEDTYIEWSRRAVPRAKDLILAREAPVGNVAIIPERIKVCLGQRTVLIRPDQQKVDPDYLVYYLNGNEVQGKFHGLTAGATVAHLNMRDIRGLEIPYLPSLETQRKISAVLSAYDDLIENNTRRIAILEEMAQTLYREWFVHFRFPGHEDVKMVEVEGYGGNGRVPEGWQVRELGSLCNMKYGKMPKKEDRVDKGFPIFSGYGIVGFHKEYLYKDREIVVIARGVGRCGEIEMSPPYAYITNIAIVFKPAGNEIEKLFLYHRLLETSLTSLNKGTAQTQVTISDLKPYQIILPPHDLQEKYVKIVAQQHSLIEILQQKNEHLIKSRDLLLPHLISGEIDVSSLDLEELS